MNHNMINEHFDRVSETLAPFTGFHKVDPYILAKASDRGTKVHQIIDAMIDGLGYDVEPGLEGYIESYQKWIANKKFIQKPKRFYDHHLKITGEVDQVYEVEYGLILVDFKTSQKEGKTWQLQMSAYKHLLKANDIPIVAMQCVKLSREGNVPIVYDYEDDFGTYLKCLELYRKFFNNQSIISSEYL